MPWVRSSSIREVRIGNITRKSKQCRLPFSGSIEMTGIPETRMSLAHPEMDSPESYVVIGMI